MNLNRLRIFHAAAAALSFTRAARELNLTQPGVSKHIRALEEEYGTRLFDRLRKRLLLTEAGEILFLTTRDVFRSIDQARTQIDELRGMSRGRLSISASITIGTYLLPELLGTFRKRHPQIEITVDTSLSMHVVDKVLSHEHEIGLVGHRPVDRRLFAEAFRVDELALVVPPRHPWAKRREPVRLRELVAELVIVAKRGSGTREIVEQQLRAAHVTLARTIEFGNTEGVKKAVEAGLGVSILSTHVAKRELTSGLIRAVPLGGGRLRRHLYFVYDRHRSLSEASKAFLNILRDGR